MKVKRTYIAAGMAALMIGITAAPTFAAPSPQTNRYPASLEAENLHVENLKAAENASQLILVVGRGEGSKVTVSYYAKEDQEKLEPGQKEDDSWVKKFETEGVYGRNGASTEKKEGDGKTPEGTFGITMAFGLLESPGSILPYHQIETGDYWVDDSDSIYYNQLVNTRDVTQSWKSAENMTGGVPEYYYGLALDYNKECVPGAGSAIFLHCTIKESLEEETGSAGCVRIPQELMKQLVQSVDKDTKIVIVSDASRLEYQ